MARKRKTTLKSTIKTTKQKQSLEQETQLLVYLGTSEKATVTGKVTGNKYAFYRDAYGMPSPTTVNIKDSDSILAMQGKACCGKPPTQLFMTQLQWNADIARAKQINR